MAEVESSVPALVDHLFRRDAGRMVSVLARALGPEHIGLAEEVVQDALVQALRQWPFAGVPDNPTAWLRQVARNRALDALRRRQVFRRKEEELERMIRARFDPPTEPAGDEFADDQLAMIFACCHPAVPADGRVALTLKAVCGFGVSEIARAFLATEPTVAQRLVRAKRRIAEEGIQLAVPMRDQIPVRLESVLRVVFLVFNEGYASHQGDELIRHDLCVEAIRLGRILAARSDTDLPATRALLALMLLQAARLPARTDADGDLVLLADQDRSLWDGPLIHEGLRQLDLSAEGDELSEYHLQAGIAAQHALAPSFADTDWEAVLALYDQLMRLAPSPIVALNRAVAVGMVRGPQAGLEAIDELAGELSLRGYYLLPAVRADFLRRLGRAAEATTCYRVALTLPCSKPERRFLAKRLAKLAP